MKSKTESAGFASCHRYFSFSLLVTFFMLLWLEDAEAFNGLRHLSSNTSTMLLMSVNAIKLGLGQCTDHTCGNEDAEVVVGRSQIEEGE